MKDLLLFLVCIFLVTAVLATTDSLPKSKQGPYFDASGGFINILFEENRAGASFGIGWRFNRNFGLGLSYAGFGKTNPSGVQGMRGIGFQARFTPDPKLLFHLEAGYVIHYTFRGDSQSYFLSYNPKESLDRIYFRFGGAFRFLRVMQAGADVFIGGAQSFDKINHQTLMKTGVYRNPPLWAGGFKLGIALPPGRPLKHPIKE